MVARSLVLEADFFERLARFPASQDPHAVLETLPRSPPARLRSGELVLTRHSDVVEVLRDPRFAKPDLPRLPLRSVRTLFRMFLLLNAPDHVRLRRTVAPLFVPASIVLRQDRVEEVARSLLGENPTIDVIREFAYPLPLALMSEWLGVRPGDEDKVARWAATLTEALDTPLPLRPAAVGRFARALITRRARPLATLRAAEGIVAYARGCLDGPSNPPRAEFLTTLRGAAEDGTISPDEAIATWVLLVIAGHETTANLIGNAVYLLLRHPDQLDMVCQSPSLIPTAIEETLRYESPVPMGMRVATVDLDVAGTRVPEGMAVIVLLAAANRDPDVFTSPSDFNIVRNTAGHLAFGHGSHFCIGAQLARLEAEIALRILLSRNPRFVHGASARWRDSFATRGLATLPVQIETAAGP